MNLRNILIVAATHKEIAPLLEMLKAGEIPMGRVRSFMVKQTPLDVLITGPGMVATAYYLGKVRGLHEYSLVLNAGIAGSFKKELIPGTCVQVTSDCFADLGSVQGRSFKPMYSMEMAADYLMPGVNPQNIIVNADAPRFSTTDALPAVAGITVNTLTGKAPKAGIADLNYATESMEGAAFFAVCKATGVHCLQIRAISNFIETPAEWDLPAAVEALSQTLISLIDEL